MKHQNPKELLSDQLLIDLKEAGITDLTKATLLLFEGKTDNPIIISTSDNPANICAMLIRSTALVGARMIADGLIDKYELTEQMLNVLADELEGGQ